MNGNYYDPNYNPNNNQNMNSNMGPNMNQQVPNQGPKFDPYNDNYDPTYDYFGNAPKSSMGPKIVKFIIILAIIAGLGFGGYKGYKYLSKTAKEAIKEEKKEEEKESDLPYDKDNPIYKKDEYGIPEKIIVEVGSSSYGDVTEDGRLSIYNRRVIPSLINVPNSGKIIKIVTDASKVYWEQVVKKTDEDFANYDPATTPAAKYGVKYIASYELFKKNRIMVFDCVLSGDMGGVPWSSLELYNFDLRYSELLELEDICVDVNTCKSYMYTFFVESLKKDKRFSDLVPDYENIIKEKLFKAGSYGFTSQGFVVVLQKGVIASDASDIFAYAIPYDYFNEYLKEDFKI